MNILLVDDNTSITKALSRLLSLKGHECVVCNDGRNALTLIVNEKFDLVLLDIAMPEMSGDQIINELEKQNKILLQPIVVLTASTISDEKIDSFTKQGVFAVLKKPVSSSVLYNIIEEAKKQKVHRYD